jgi:hypothetical protein
MGDIQTQLPVKLTDGTNTVAISGTSLNVNVTGTVTVSPQTTQTVSGTVTTVPSATQTITGTVTTAGVPTQTVAGTVTTVPSATQTITGTVVSAGVATQTVAGTVTTVPSATQTITGTVTTAGVPTQTVAGTVTTVPTSTQTVGGTVTAVPTGTQAITGTVSIVPPTTQTVAGTVTSVPTEVTTGLLSNGFGIFYGTSPTIANSSTGTILYTVTTGKTLYLKNVIATSSGAPCKVSLVAGTTTLAVGFYSTAVPFLNIPFSQPIAIASGTVVGIQIENNAQLAQDVYAALTGHEQ